MRVKARSSPRCAFRRTPRSGWVSDTGRRSIARKHQILTFHMFGFRDTEEGERRWSKVRELAVLRRPGTRIGGDERHAVRRMRRVRADAVVGDQLLRVAVVGRDEADAAE